MNEKVIFEKRSDQVWRCHMYGRFGRLCFFTWTPFGRRQWQLIDREKRIHVFSGVPIPEVCTLQKNGTLLMEEGCEFIELARFGGTWV